ncbi:hypothetical protein EIM48_04965 [Pseudoxanthomonas sp. SGNA-20]|jgi:hypothetical protein|uniref:hypothetical protein n=1 Tax=unclassified Pseudoxanthomonas TaxID=2645906 RepID=UPI0002F78028|nr:MULTISPECIES: hypothetical protein [unclassified Pseudoxanthomonas]RRN59380.1 hypothetical protein EIM48_04965 [Pseudoxanthomonas sp. SGNA-20]
MDALKPAVGWLLGGIVAIALGLAAKPLLPERIADIASVMLVSIGVGSLASGLIRWRLPALYEAAPADLRRRYTREILLAMAAYMVMVVATVSVLRDGGPEGPLRALVALLPVPPIAFVLRAMVRYIRDADEMQQRIELEAVSIATALVALLYMSGGFLQAAKVIDLPAAAVMIWVFPLLCATYGVAKFLVMRRYQ